MDILIKNTKMPINCCFCLFKLFSTCILKERIKTKGYHDRKRHPKCPLIPVPEHNDLADKSVIIERMGAVYEALYDKVDKKALSECHVAFLKAVMYAPTVIPSTVKIPTDGIEPKGVWDETLTTDTEGKRTT